MLIFAVAAIAQVPPGAVTTARSFLRAGDLINLCDRNAKACLAYVEGAVDMNAFLETTGLVPKRVCIAPGVGLAQVTADAVSWLRQHPVLYRQGAGGAVWAALAETHPCASDT